ncbi:MAG: SycD/LcrH family type III secretion system chaperone [Parachlamydiaceae bacterium]|nr:SycD/LcrH family type III secretion system chaperone [Parachlamydiaceae bacterium]
MQSEKKQVLKAAEAIGEGVNPNIIDNFSEIMNTIFTTGKVPKDALGFNDERMSATYGQAYRLYNTGKFAEASYLFRLLVILDSTDPKYYLGLGACFHMLKEYAAAVQVYMACGVMDGNSPIPFFHASDCYTQLRDKASTLLMLEMAVKRAGDKPEYQVLKERALLTIQNLKKEIGELGVKLE